MHESRPYVSLWERERRNIKKGEMREVEQGKADCWVTSTGFGVRRESQKITRSCDRARTNEKILGDSNLVFKKDFP